MDDNIVMLIPIISVIGTFSATIFWVYMHYSSRHKERMALLESGQTADIFKSYKSVGSTGLKYGIILFSIGAGILMGYFLENMGMDDEIAYFSMIFLFSGAGLIGYYLFIAQRERGREVDL